MAAAPAAATPPIMTRSTVEAAGRGTTADGSWGTALIGNAGPADTLDGMLAIDVPGPQPGICPMPRRSGTGLKSCELRSNMSYPQME